MSTPTLSEPRAYVSMDEAAAYLSVSRDTIRRMIRRGDLTARKIGKSIRVSVTSLENAGRPIPAVDAR